MLRWFQFQEVAPDIASVGARLLYRPHEAKVAILATVDHRSRPWLAPVCPIFSGAGVYVLAKEETPKVRQLRRNPWFALHAMVGDDDLEFQISGHVRDIDGVAQRNAVLSSVTFPNYGPYDPLFELLIERALTVTWRNPNTPWKKSWAAS